MELPDIQNTLVDSLPLDKVGVCNVRIPLTVRRKDGQLFKTTAQLSSYCSLSGERRGAHMSRFPLTLLELLSKEPLTEQFLQEAPQAIARAQQAAEASVKLKFPYELPQTSLLSGHTGFRFCDVVLEAVFRRGGLFKYLTVTDQVIAVCPCSKELSLALEKATGARGAPHMQRSFVSITVQFEELLWIEDLASWIYQVAPSPHFIVKRIDEQELARLSWKCTNFVEDIARNVASFLEEDRRVLDYVVVVRNEESIHPFDVVAVKRKGVAGGLQ